MINVCTAEILPVTHQIYVTILHVKHLFLPSANEVCEGYVFIRVCNSVHGGGSPGPYPGGRLRGLVWGSPGSYPGEVWGSSQRGLQVHTQGGGWGVWLVGVSRPRPGGPGPDGEGGVSHHALRQTHSQQMATAADGTHPTGMHSCLYK